MGVCLLEMGVCFPKMEVCFFENGSLLFEDGSCLLERKGVGANFVSFCFSFSHLLVIVYSFLSLRYFVYYAPSVMCCM